MYGKQTERAIAAMSRLAEVWDGGRTRLSALEIATQRNLPAPMVAKLLTSLSQAGLVTGSPGPGGGYSLARSPDRIALQDVFVLFEREDTSTNCPFGGGVCGVGDPCPLHEPLVTLQAQTRRLLRETCFDIFRKAVQEQGLKPAPPDAVPLVPERQSYRAPQRGPK